MYRDLTKRIMALALSVCMIAGMVDLSGLTVRAATGADTIQNSSISVASPVVYDGGAQQPAVTVTDWDGNTLTQGTDYTLSYDNNVNAGMASVTVTNAGYPDDSVTETFSIDKKDINNCDGFPSSADLATEIPRAGVAATPAVQVTDSQNKKNTTLSGMMAKVSASVAADVDYTYDFANNTNAGEATVTITGRNNYTGSKQINFTVSVLDGSKISFDFVDSMEGKGMPYDGKEIRPEIADTVSYDGDKIAQKDYEVRYKNNVYAGQGEAWIVVTGGRYSGLESEVKTFPITKNISATAKFERKIELAKAIPEKPFKGEGVPIELDKEDVVLVDPDYENTPLKRDVDYTILKYENNDKEGTARVQFQGIGKYTGTRWENFEIVAAHLYEDMVQTDGGTYTYDIDASGNAKDLFEEVKKNIVVSNGDIVYQEGPDKDYTVTRGDPGTSAGTHYVVVTSTGKGMLRPGDSVRKSYVVKPRPLNDPGITMTITNYTDDIYNGRPKTPGVKITYRSQSGGTKDLIANADYVMPLSYSNNTDATTPESRASVKATGKGNFGGETEPCFFDIKPIELTEANTAIGGIASPAEYAYTGDPIEITSLSVKYNGSNLTKNKDYTVSYENNTDVGTARLTITAQGNYKGTFSRNFTITQRSLKDTAVRITLTSSMQYTGQTLKPEVTVTHNGHTLVENTHYTLDYGENINIGTGSVTLTGMGNYKDSVQKTFTIAARNINSGTLSVLDEDPYPPYDFMAGTADDRKYSYTGKEITFTLNVSYENADAGMLVPLTEGTDYTLEFSKNKEIGTAQVTIKAMGNFTGSKTLDFTIKGNFADESFLTIEIPEQVYTSNPIIPKDAKVTFAGKELVDGKDFTISCDEYTNNTDAGEAVMAIVTGQGNYFGEARATFKIRPFDLSKDDLEEKEYVVGNIQEEYPFIEVGHSIQPLPKIVHNGNELVKDTNYTVEYGDNNKVGPASLTIVGDNANYIEKRKKEFKIVPYALDAEYAEGYVDIQGVADVILDSVIAGNDMNAEMADGAVVMSDLKVMYTPVRLDGTEMAARELTADEYDVVYKDNKKIGTATITINGKGNFGGTLTRTFRIRGDLSSDRTQVAIDDCDYTPGKNTPVPTVTYTYDSGATETLVAGEDYTVEYENNTDSTVKSGAKAKATILPVMEEDGSGVKGNYAQSGSDPRSAEFEIRQRDLANTVGTEETKDPLLNVAGIDEAGYEYTGLPIVPQFQVLCDETELTVGEDGDYTFTAENNLDVYTFAVKEDGTRGDRLMPTLIVTAAQDADGNYNGNYKNAFRMEFKINPRQITEETIRTLLRVKGEEYDNTQVPEVDYTGEAIKFPHPDDPNQTDMDVTWSKDGQNTSLREGKDYSVTYEKNVGIGEAEIVIKHIEYSNYEGSYTRKFKIMASIEVVDDPNPPLRYMTLEYDHNVPYGIVDVFPKMVFKDVSSGAPEPYILQEGEDFLIIKATDPPVDKGNSQNNCNVASENLPEEQRPTIVVQGIGCYRGTVKRYYNIIPKDLSKDEGDITIEIDGTGTIGDYENAFIYTGQAITPTVKVYNHGQLMQPERDYVVKGYVNNTAISTEDRKAEIIIEAVAGGNYTGQKSFYFNIVQRPIDGMQMEILGDGPIYFSRGEKRPEVEVSYMNGTDRIVLGKNDYDITYENNINVANQFAENAPVVIVTGKGSYSGTLRKTFSIEPEPLDESNDDFDITAASAFYIGTEATTTVTVIAKDGTPLVEGTDFEMGAYRDNINAGTGYVTIHGIGNYSGSREVPFQIIAPDYTDSFRIAEIPQQTYNGKAIEPKVSVSLELGEGQQITLTESDYSVEYQNNINAGTATVIVKGIGNFGGEARAEFKIAPRSIGTEEGINPGFRISAVEDQTYTGVGLTPDVELSFDGRPGGAVTPMDGREAEGGLLEKNVDYTLSYHDNVTVGTAGVTVTGIGNYSGTIEVQFRILGPMNLADVSKIPAQPYTGSEVTPKPDVTFAGKKLTEGEEYTLSYTDNIVQGTATITITGLGWYTGEKKVTFEIARDFSGETHVKGLAAAYTYTGKGITPSVLVEDHGKILSKGTDYQIGYSSNINVGTATVTVTGIGKYSGTASANFKITPQNIGRATASKIGNQSYDGKKKKPDVTIKSDGVTLKKGTDFSVSHVDNKIPGKARVIIKGKGNFTGTKTISYKIVVPKVKGVKVAKYTSSSITFTWKQNKLVSGYEIYNSKNKRVAHIRKNSTVQATVSKLKAGKSETYRVRAVVNQGKYFYSDFVKIKGVTAPKTTQITSITSSKSKQVALKWKKMKGAKNYQVFRSTSPKGKYKKIATTNKISYTDKKATKGKTYHYKIRVGKKIGSKIYYSDYSRVRSIAAKK